MENRQLAYKRTGIDLLYTGRPLKQYRIYRVKLSL